MNGHEQVQQAYLERIPTLNFNADGRLENVNEGGAFLVFGGRRQYDKMMTSSTSDIEARTLIRPGASSLSELQEVSSSDLLARLAASTLRREWGDAIVVELCICDAAGAFTTVKVEVDVLEQPSTAARGYTLLILRPATMSTSAQTPSNDFVNSPDLAPKPTARMNGLTDTWREQPPSLSEVYRTLSVVTARVTSTGVPRTDSPLPTSEDEMDTSSSTSTSTSAIPAPAWTPPLQELKDLLDHVPTICFTASAAGQVEWLNQAWYDYTALENVDRMTPEVWMSMFHPDDLPIVLPIWIDSMSTGRPFRFQYRVKRRDSVMRWCVCSGKAVRDDRGQVASWACSIADVNDLVEAQQQSLRVREHVNAVVAGGGLLLLSADRDGVITLREGSMNTMHCLTDVTADGALPGVGQKLEIRDEALREARRAILAGEQASSFIKTEGYDVHGKRIIGRFRLAPLIDTVSSLDMRIGGFILIGSDITEMLATEEALRVSRDEKARLHVSALAAQEASRLKTEFLTSLSHELRSPIAAILSICELLSDDVSLASEHRDLVAKAARAGDALLELIGTILDVRKIEAGQMTVDEEPFMLSTLIEDARVFSIAAGQKGLAFEEDIGPFYSGPLLGDKIRLRQVISNALANAQKFTDHGTVTFRLRQIRETISHVDLKFDICDTGCGIAEDVLPTLFQPFRQADPSTSRQYGGTGLGLVISRKLMELMQGTCTLSSTLGVGTTNTIQVRLPKAPAHIASPTLSSQIWNGGRAPTQTSRNPREYKILLAEDNALLRDLTTRVLRKLEFQVQAVPDGAAAVQAVHAEHFDLILMDGQMPQVSGYEATAQIRASTDARIATMPIVALTASAIRGDSERCFAAGMSGYLAKPVRSKDLEEMIWMQLESRLPAH